MEKHVNFGSRMGAIFAAAGSAVGLGNVWRFPTEVGNNGGAAFILIYLVCILFIGIPIMVCEFVIGRHTQSNMIDGFRKLAPGRWWRVIGYQGVLVAFLILSYYIVVSGWTLFYSVESLAGNLVDDGVGEGHHFAEYFGAFVSDPWWSLGCAAAFMAIVHLVIARGVQSGIERFSKVMMPMLLLIIGVLVVCAFSMPGIDDGLRFLLKPDFSKITVSVVLSAMGQAFFSLSLAMGCLCTYASYFNPKTRLVSSAMSVAVIDTFVAVLSGFIIFPAVFSVPGIEADAGPGLVFITLPSVFNMAFHAVPWLGYMFSGLFYILLFLAALTSAMSLHESVTAYVYERFHISRRRASLMVSVSCMCLGVLCCLSFGPLSDWTVGGMTVFDLFDFVSSKVILPLGGLLLVLFTGWYLDRDLVRDEITNRGELPGRVFGVFMFLVRWVAPVAIGVIFVQGLLGIF